MIPEYIKERVKARLSQPVNVGKLIWVEITSDEHWIIHASTGPEAKRRMQIAHKEGRFYATASEILK